MDVQAQSSEPPPILTVSDLDVRYGTARRSAGSPPVQAVCGVSLTLAEGECLGIIGESGSGKSTLAFAIANLLPPPGHITGGSIALRGSGDLTGLSERRWREIRGRRIGIVFQGSQSMFNPIMTIEQQFRDIFRAHGEDPASGLDHAREIMARAQLDSQRVLRSYPHELSGGMRQRVGIVSVIMMTPEVLILDEPTTALDVVSQAYVLDIVRHAIKTYRMGVILVTHDFAVVSGTCDRVAVMYAGQFVEMGSTASVYEQAGHPYTRGLIASVPSLADQGAELRSIPGLPPDMRRPPPGCRFAARCRFAEPRCSEWAPSLEPSLEAGHEVMCVRAAELDWDESGLEGIDAGQPGEAVPGLVTGAEGAV